MSSSSTSRSWRPPWPPSSLLLPLPAGNSIHLILFLSAGTLITHLIPPPSSSLLYLAVPARMSPGVHCLTPPCHCPALTITASSSLLSLHGSYQLDCPSPWLLSLPGSYHCLAPITVWLLSLPGSYQFSSLTPHQLLHCLAAAHVSLPNLHRRLNRQHRF